ncbi:MAG: hypothetical protein ACR2NN_18375 [Bryobacteraceae bacterium]
MRGWGVVLRLVHDNITIIFFALVVAIFGVGWLVVEAFRSHQTRDEIFQLRRRLRDLERERVAGKSLSIDPIVMPERWIRIGSASTTSDGGCLILVERVAPAQHSAVLSVRVDGYAVRQSEPLRVGDQLELPGKSGTYLVELYNTGASQAQVGVALRSKHREYAPE